MLFVEINECQPVKNCTIVFSSLCSKIKISNFTLSSLVSSQLSNDQSFRTLFKSSRKRHVVYRLDFIERTRMNYLSPSTYYYSLTNINDFDESNSIDQFDPSTNVFLLKKSISDSMIYEKRLFETRNSYDASEESIDLDMSLGFDEVHLWNVSSLKSRWFYFHLGSIKSIRNRIWIVIEGKRKRNSNELRFYYIISLVNTNFLVARSIELSLNKSSARHL